MAATAKPRKRKAAAPKFTTDKDAEVNRLAKIGVERISSRARGKGPGKGDGWGGPAKGADPDRKPIAGPEHLTPGCDKAKRASERMRERRERVAWMEDKLLDIAEGAERDETKITAITALHAIYEGRPVQRNVNLEVDDVARLTDREVIDQLQAVTRKIAETGDGATSKKLPKKPADVVH